MGIETWSKTAASNTQAEPVGIVGSRDTPSDVDNWGRDKMAGVREWYETAEWIDYGGTVTQTDSNEYTIENDVTSFYIPGRRVQLYGSTLGYLYGTVVSSSYSSPNTTIVVDVDGGTALTTNLSRSWYGILSPDNSSVPTHILNIGNILVASDFRTAPWQTGTTITASSSAAPAAAVNNDGSYIVDNNILISDGDDIVDIQQASDKSFQFVVQTVNKQFGIVQLIENEKMQSILDYGYVSLAFEAKGDNSQNVRAAVLSWTGTQDEPTKDIISAWAGGGTNPTFAANYTLENTPTNFTLSNDYQTFSIPNISIDTANVKNLAVVIWLDDTTTNTNDTINIKRWKLQISQSIGDFEYISPSDSLFDAQYYYAKSFLKSVAPARNAGAFGSLANISSGTAIGALTVCYNFPRTMLATPSIITYNPVQNNSDWYGSPGSVSALVINKSERTLNISNGGVVVDQIRYEIHITADSRIGV